MENLGIDHDDAEGADAATGAITTTRYNSLRDEVRAYAVLNQTNGPDVKDVELLALDFVTDAKTELTTQMYEVSWHLDVVKKYGMQRIWWMARKLLARYASSAIMERVFSGSGRTVSKLRCSMNTDTVKELMVCRYNMHLLPFDGTNEEEAKEFWLSKLPYLKKKKSKK